MTDNIEKKTIESRMADGDPLAFRDIIDNYFKIYSEEVAVSKTIEQADTNPWAAVKVAEWCENNSYPNILSTEAKITFLEKAANCSWAGFTMRHLHEFNSNSVSQDSLDAYIWSDPVGRAWEALGNYYLQFDDEQALNQAYDFLIDAGLVGFQVREQLRLYRHKMRLLNKHPKTAGELYPKDREEEEEEIKRKEWEQEYLHSLKIDEKLLNFVNNNKSFQEEYTRQQFQKVNTYLEEEFSNYIWAKATPETKVYLATGFFCFEQLKLINIGNIKIDFSVAINPVVKSLEEELSLRFYTRYIKYLKLHYPTPEDYFLVNEIAPYDKETRNVIASSNKSKEFIYNNPDKPTKFTLGSFVFVVGYGWNLRSNEAKIDKTMLEYCKIDLLSPTDFCKMKGISFSAINYEKEISSWLLELGKAVESVKDIRNKASHGGQICSDVDCQYCYDAILLVKKILIQLLEVTKLVN